MFDLEENIRVNNEQIHKIDDIGNSINIESLEQELKALEKETEDQSFWNDAESSSKKLARITELKKKIEFICDFCNTTPTIFNGSIRTIEHTNLTYVEPHRIIIKDKMFLAFNYETNIYIENLTNSIMLKDLEDYIKTI